MTRRMACRFEPAYAPSNRAPVSCRCGHQARYDRRSRSGTTDAWHCGGGGRRSAASRRARVLGEIERARSLRLARRDAFGGRARFASVAVGWPRRASSLEGPSDRAAVDGNCALSRTSDRHAARAIAVIGPVTASSCQLSPRSGLRSRRPSAMPQTSSSARAASVYGIDSPGTGSSRQASRSQR